MLSAREEHLQGCTATQMRGWVWHKDKVFPTGVAFKLDLNIGVPHRNEREGTGREVVEYLTHLITVTWMLLWLAVRGRSEGHSDKSVFETAAKEKAFVTRVFLNALIHSWGGIVFILLSGDRIRKQPAWKISPYRPLENQNFGVPVQLIWLST